MKRHPLAVRVLETVGSIITIGLLIAFLPAVLLLLLALAVMVHAMK